MNKKAFILISILILLASINTVYSQQYSTKQFIVVIDAGHGGRDNGASHGNIHEKEITLKVANKINEWIGSNCTNVEVIMTRDRDVFLPLSYRAYIANKYNADLFISLHANTFHQASINGSETYIMGIHSSEENLKVAQKENSVILLEEDYQTTYEGFDPHLAESYIMFELIQNNFLEQSINFAAAVQSQFELTGKKSRGVKSAGFLVLKRTYMPSVLIELGYLSNKNDRNYLVSDQGQSELANSIGKAFSQYLSKYYLKTEIH